MISVEYLFPFETSDGICRDLNSFNSLLASNSNLRIEGDFIHYKGSKYHYSVDFNEVAGQECSVFHVQISVSRLTDKFREMLNVVKKTVGVHLRDQMQVLWDGVAFEWSKELYPEINILENSMRKLISKFMLITLGTAWQKTTVPKEVKDSIKSGEQMGPHGILYEVDFIQLSSFLFKAYALESFSNAHNVIDNATDLDKLKQDLSEFIPKNNWDRYFSDIVDCESGQLQKNGSDFTKLDAKSRTISL